MLPYKIALACVLLPLLTVHLTLFISIAVNNLEGCIPYWSRCHSISATGRQYPEFFVFKALMIPTAVLMMAYWLMLHLWLRKISAQQVNPMMITTLGLIAAAALIVYTVTLGAEGEPYALARRIGVIFYFAFSAFAHLLLLAKLQLLNMQALRIENEQNAMFWLCSVLVISGILSAVAGYLWVGWDNWDNAYEWWFSLIMIALFYVVGKMWKKTQFTVVFEIRKNGE
jgi:hypothetical protein